MNEDFKKRIKYTNLALLAFVGLLFGLDLFQYYIKGHYDPSTYSQFGILIYTIYIGGFAIIYFAHRKHRVQQVKHSIDLADMLQMFFLLLGMNFLGSLTVVLLEQILDLFGITLTTIDAHFVFGDWRYNLSLIIEACVIAPLVEELFFRDVLLRGAASEKAFSTIVYCSLCFGLFHGNLPQAIPAFLSGLVLCYIDVKAGCVWPSIVLHALNNILALKMVNLAPSYPLYLFFFLQLLAAYYTLSFLFSHLGKIKTIIKELRIKPYFSNLAGIVTLIALFIQVALSIRIN